MKSAIEPEYKKTKRNCPVCDSGHYHILNNYFRCTSCGTSWSKHIDYRVCLSVNKKFLTLRKHFRKRHGISKEDGVEILSDLGVIHLMFSKTADLKPNQDKRTPYTINCKDLCDRIGKGHYSLKLIRGGLFKIEKIRPTDKRL